MLTTCPWGYRPCRQVCATCKYVGRCEPGQPYQAPVVLNGAFGVWHSLPNTIVVGDADGHTIPMEERKLDALIAVLEAAKQELKQAHLHVDEPVYLKISPETVHTY